MCRFPKIQISFNSLGTSYVDCYTHPQEITESAHNSNGSKDVQHTSLSNDLNLLKYVIKYKGAISVTGLGGP